jgi:hypothetical protein
MSPQHDWGFVTYIRSPFMALSKCKVNFLWIRMADLTVWLLLAKVSYTKVLKNFMCWYQVTAGQRNTLDFQIKCLFIHCREYILYALVSFYVMENARTWIWERGHWGKIPNKCILICIREWFKGKNCTLYLIPQDRTPCHSYWVEICFRVSSSQKQILHLCKDGYRSKAQQQPYLHKLCTQQHVRKDTHSRCIQTWSWHMADPNAHTQANTKYISYHSFGQSAGVFAGVRRQSSRWHNMWMWAISAMGVIFLNRERQTSRHGGTYLSNKTVRFTFSDCCSRPSIQLVTKLKDIRHKKAVSCMIISFRFYGEYITWQACIFLYTFFQISL